jgi:hypothetical protein
MLLAKHSPLAGTCTIHVHDALSGDDRCPIA